MDKAIVAKYGETAAHAIEYLIDHSDFWDADCFYQRYISEIESEAPVIPHDPFGEQTDSHGRSIYYNEKDEDETADWVQLNPKLHYIVEKELQDTYGRSATIPMMFLIERLDKETVEEFMMNFIYREKLAEITTEKVIVRPIEDENLMRGNTGRYLIYIQGEHGKEFRVKFVNKSSLVFYLIHLIQRKQIPEGELPALDLDHDRLMTVKLYLECYDITYQEAVENLNKLRFRQEGKTRRAGRKHEIIRDINTQLESVFDEFGKNAIPFTISARQHLALPGHKIIFEGKAEQLLEKFKFFEFYAKASKLQLQSPDHQK